MMAPAALLRRVGRVDFDERSASFFRFARELGKECRPRGITYALGKRMIMKHAVYAEVFYADDPVGIDDLAAFLMGEVLPSPSDTLMDTGDSLTVCAPFWRAFRQLGMLALYLCQCLFFLTKEARVLNLFTIRERSKGLESHVDTNLGRHIRQAFRLTLYREGDIPLPSRGTLKSTRLDLALDLAMVDHLECTNLGEDNAAIMGDAKTRLREGEAVIASIAFEARKTRFLSMFFAASEEGLHGQVDPHRYVLQDLGMHAIKGSAFSFQEHKGLLLLKERQARTILLIGVFALPKQVVIEPTALFKGGIELVYLFLG